MNCNECIQDAPYDYCCKCEYGGKIMDKHDKVQLFINEYLKTYEVLEIPPEVVYMMNTGKTFEDCIFDMFDVERFLKEN